MLTSNQSTRVSRFFQGPSVWGLRRQSRITSAAVSHRGQAVVSTFLGPISAPICRSFRWTPSSGLVNDPRGHCKVRAKAPVWHSVRTVKRYDVQNESATHALNAPIYAAATDCLRTAFGLSFGVRSSSQRSLCGSLPATLRRPSA